ncbi:MAG TPA: flagellar basal body-associated FliL family protein [Terriglobia bacterium]|nr:flagellar basal body-associated FliL family protein [Terriglobia bacterium]
MPNKPQAAKGKPKSKSKSSSLLVFLLLAAIGAGAYWFVSRRHAVEAASSAPKPVSVTSVIHLDSFVVNLADRNQSSFLKISIDLGVTSAPAEGKSGDPNAAVTPKIRDTILSVLSTWQSGGLLAPDGKAKLKEQILDALHQQVPTVPIKEVYFTEFLVQR